MKHRLLYILLVIFSVFMGTDKVYAWGESTGIVLNEAGEKTNEAEYTFTAPGNTLTFTIKRQSGGIGGVKVYMYDSSGNETALNGGEAFSCSTSGTPHTVDLTTYSNYLSFRKIKFEKSGTLRRYISNVKITRANTLDVTPTPIDLGEVQLNSTETKEVKVAYNNNTYNQQLTAKSSNSAFILSANTWTIGEAGTQTFNVSFTGRTLGTHSGTITLTNTNGKSQIISVTATVVGKYTPTFNFNLNSAYTNHIYTLSDIFSTDNNSSDCKVTYTTSDESRAKIIGDELFVYNQIGNFSVTVNQEGNDDWEDYSATYTVNVSEGTGDVYIEEKDNYTFNSVNLYGEYTYTFTGPCDKISYSAYKQSGGWDSDLVVSISKDNTNWQTIGEEWQPGEDSETKTEYLENYPAYLYPTHIKFDRNGAGSLSLYLTDIKFYMAAYMTPQQQSLSMGEWMQGSTSDTQSVLVDWSDVADYNNLTVTCDNPYFNVSIANNPCTPANATWGTSNPRWGQSTVSVSYSPQTVGTHTGTVYIRHDKRFATFTVSGTAFSNELELNPAVNPSTQRTGVEYQTVTLRRTLPAGFSTLTLPFDTNISELTGSSDADYVAQLALVTYNEADGYTLYFRKTDGAITAHQPYVVYRTNAVTNPQWTNCLVDAPAASSLSGASELKGWTMEGNYEPSFSMSAKYGLAGGLLRKGAAGSTINAYTAYFTSPSAAQNVRTRVAVMDEWGNTTYVGELGETEDGAQVIFGTDGVRLDGMKTGINIVRSSDGSVRKILKK